MMVSVIVIELSLCTSCAGTDVIVTEVWNITVTDIHAIHHGTELRDRHRIMGLLCYRNDRLPRQQHTPTWSLQDCGASQKCQAIVP